MEVRRRIPNRSYHKSIQEIRVCRVGKQSRRSTVSNSTLRDATQDLDPHYALVQEVVDEIGSLLV